MRPLTEDELKTFFTKLSKYIGKNIRHLIDRADENYCFRLHQERVYYIKENLLNMASMVDSDKVASLGTCFGKFTKTRKFRLHVTCLDYISQYALFKMWIKPSGVMSFLYGKNVYKAHLGRITEGTPKYHGVVLMSMNDLPLGFGVAAFSTDDCRKVESTAIVAFHQSDVGEYLRKEDSGHLM